MKFTISENVFQKFPEAMVGIVVAKNVNNSGENREIMQLLRTEEDRIKKELNIDDLAQNPLIQNWRKTYRQLGEDKDKASHEALIRRVLKGNEIRHINKLVDIYNYVSLKHKTPLGGENIDKIDGDIHLKLSNGDERFILLGSQEPSHPDTGEVIYCDDKKVLCRKWNWRESDETKLTEETKSAFLVIDALPPFTEASMKTAAHELSELVKKHCGATANTFILNSKTHR